MKRIIKKPAEGRKNRKKMITPEIAALNRSGKIRRTKFGSYSVGMTAIAVAAAVFVNLIASEIPSQYTQIDMSGLQLSVLSDQTKEFAESLTEDITLYYIVQDSTKDTYVERLLERYDDLSSHITVVEKDPVLYPKFTSQYTDENLTDNSIIAVCGDRSRIIDYNDMYEMEFNYSYYTYETTGFDAEGQITSALAALQAEEIPKIYTLTGHNEISLTDSLLTSIEKENIETDSLNLVTAECVPEDADCLMILSPTSDFSDGETQKIMNYLRTGGKAIIVTDYTGTEMPNLSSVLEYYGLQIADGVVMEGNSNYYVQIPYYVVPDINSTAVSSGLTGGNAYVLLAAAQGLQKTEDVRDGVSISAVLSTSDDAYSKIDIENMTTYNKEDGDVDGPFDLGVIVSETVELTDELLAETSQAVEEEELGRVALDAESVDEAAAEEAVGSIGEVAVADEENASEEVAESSEDASEAEDTEDVSEDSTEAAVDSVKAAETAETKLAVFTSSALLDDSANQMVSGGNASLFMNTVSWICGQSVSVSIPSKSLSMDYLTVTSASGSFWSIVTIAIIPAAFLIGGLIIWLRRRKQ